jgi:hypothetical protein
MSTPSSPVAAARWAPRLCAFAPVVAFAAFVIGWLDPHGGENPIAATALAVAFLAAGVGLAGLFLSLLASERVPGFVRPNWALPCAIGGIAGGFLGGLLGVIT